MTETNPHRISSYPEDVRTHFVLVAPCNKKGQGRYRCLMCNHEFASTGKIRLAQHIVGLDDVGSNFKNVRACPNPYMPLKQALLEQRQRHEELSSADILANLRTIDKVNSERSTPQSFLLQHSTLAASSDSNFMSREKSLTPAAPKRTAFDLMSAAYMIATAAPVPSKGSEENKAQAEDLSEHGDEVDSESELAGKKRPIVIPTDENPLDVQIPSSAHTSPAEESKSKASELSRKKRKMNPAHNINNSGYPMMSSVNNPSAEISSMTSNLSIERLHSIFQFIHQISPQALQLAIFLEGMKDQQQKGNMAAPMPFNPMDIAKAISTLQNPPLPAAFPSPYFGYPTNGGGNANTASGAFPAFPYPYSSYLPTTGLSNASDAAQLLQQMRGSHQRAAATAAVSSSSTATNSATKTIKPLITGEGIGNHEQI